MKLSVSPQDSEIVSYFSRICRNRPRSCFSNKHFAGKPILPMFPFLPPAQVAGVSDLWGIILPARALSTGNPRQRQQIDSMAILFVSAVNPSDPSPVNTTSRASRPDPQPCKLVLRLILTGLPDAKSLCTSNLVRRASH
jgi:hypothetical protein